jgi:hypothetical protein
MESGVNVTFRIPNWLDKICAWPVVWYRRRKFGYDFRRIDLGEGEFTIVDSQDYYRFGKFKWHLTGDKRKFYAVRELKVDSTRTTLLRLHREIMSAPMGLLVDHKNNNGLDNRRSNLRLATHSQNTHNRPKTKSKTSSRYIGVYFDKNCRKWHVRIFCMGEKIDLGRFADEEAAARAYDEAAKKYVGEFARLNFPEEAPVSSVRSPQD